MLQQAQPLISFWHLSWKGGTDSLALFWNAWKLSVCIYGSISYWIERSMCAGHFWAARCAGSLCDFVCPKSVSMEPQAWRVWTHPGPNSPDTSHHYTHFSPGNQKYSSSRYFISVLGEQAAVLFNSFQTCPRKHAVTACRWQGCCSDGKCNAAWHCLCCWNHGLGTHVTLTKGLCKHKASALLSWTFMVPNEYFMCDTKIAMILWATSNRLCNFGITIPVHILSQKKI